MNKLFKNIVAAGFLALFLPYTMTFLMNGREGIHQEEELSELEYQVLYQLIEQDNFWMEDGTLDLMAILYRTECVREKREEYSKKISPEFYMEDYERMYQAVVRTQGQVVTIDGEYRELPYCMVSAGVTRDGRLLGEEFSYLPSVECPQDLGSDIYFTIYNITEEELQGVLGEEFELEQMSVERDEADYAIRVICPDGEWQGEQFRMFLHLPSSCFWIERSEKGVRIAVKGNGHGFGISLYTANCMIQQGVSTAEIIRMFYQNAECITIP